MYFRAFKSLKHNVHFHHVYNIRKNFNTVLSYRPVRSKNMAQKKKKGRSNDPAKAVEIEGSTNATA